MCHLVFLRNEIFASYNSIFSVWVFSSIIKTFSPMIVAFVGLPGEGKTLSMIDRLEKHLVAGRTIYTNVPFFYPRSVYDGHGLRNRFFNYYPDYDMYGYRPIFLDFNNFNAALRHANNAIFALDEASIMLSNQFWQHMDMNLIQRLAQSRKQGVDIYYTTQRLKHSLSRLRDLTNEVIESKKYDYFGVQYFRNVSYDPEFFNHKIRAGSANEGGYILDTHWISHRRAKYLYSCYDTKYEIMGSILNQADYEAPIEVKNLN